MKGFVKHALGPSGVELRELPEPTPKDGELKVKVLAEGKLSLAPFVSLKTPLENWREAFDAVLAKKVYKAVLMPDNSFEN